MKGGYGYDRWTALVCDIPKNVDVGWMNVGGGRLEVG